MGLFLKLLVSLIVVIGNNESTCYRILGIFPFNAKSHMMMFEQLMKGLAGRGHQVDVVSSFIQKKPYPNYTDIYLPTALPKMVNNMSYDTLHDILKNDMIRFLATQGGNLICEKGLQDPQIQNIIKNPPNNPPYDLVIVEIFAAHCFAAIGHHLNVPVIGISSAAFYPWHNDIVGNPENLAFVPNNFLSFHSKMNFFKRFYNVVHTFYFKYIFYQLTSEQSDLIRKYVDPNAPGIRELENNMALVLTNTHPSLNGARPHVPAVIEVGGLHVQEQFEVDEIPAADLKWLDESVDGFIYFTFGSMVTIESFPKSDLDVLYKSLGKISPVRILMKVPEPKLLPPGLPNNIRTFKWMPQIKVLKHKNIRAFITHGGLMGSQEAVIYSVPIIGIPLFADQFVNIDILVEKNVAIKIDKNDITEEKFDHALDEILHNPIYRKSMKELSERFLDRPLSAMDTACFWVEFVIRRGNKAMRSGSLDLTWWQISLLDVYAAILILALSIISIIILFLRCIVNLLTDKKTTKSNDKKRN